jgi:RHS repeat-associated protein
LENGLPVVCANDRKSLNPTVNQTNNRFTLTEDYEYDANGNMTRDADGRRFTYDALNKQTQVKDSNNQPLGTYVYDGDGKRIKKLGSTENTLFVYDAFGSLVAEYAITPPPSNPTPNVNYLTTDTLGSPRIITGKNGEILSRRDFMPFGEEIAANENNRKAALGYNGGITTRQAFTGYEKDIESSLEFAQNRYYANKHGRFTTPDPLMASGNVQDAQSWNRYAYVRNNPLNLTDPLGLIYGEGVEDGRNVVKWFESREAMVAAGFTELTTFIYALNGGFQVFNPTGAQGAEWFATAGQAVEQFIKWGGSPGAAEKFLGRAVGFPQAAAIVAVVVGGLAVAQEGVETQVREGVVCDSRTGVCVQLQKSQANSQDLTDEELNEMVPPVQNITNTATPNPQDPNEKPPQDPNKPTKDQSFNNVVNNPQENLVGKSADEVAKILGPGWQRGNYGKTGTGWKFTNGDKVVFYHEGGRHKGAYWGYSSGQTGKVKFVGKDYVPLPGDKAKIISIVTNK